MLRRTMAAVAGEVGSAGSGLKMPKLEETTVSLQWITEQEIKTYQKLASKAQAIKGAVHHELLSNVMRMRQACNHPSLATVVDREDTVELDENVAAGTAAANSFALDAGESLAESDDETAAMGGGKYECAKLSALMKVLDEAKVRVVCSDCTSLLHHLIRWNWHL
jgi:SNF2 family DNA or RNA helicase